MKLTNKLYVTKGEILIYGELFSLFLSVEFRAVNI